MVSSDSDTPDASVRWIKEKGPFHYDPLQDEEIRLLELRPAPLLGDPIKCRLIHVKLYEHYLGLYDILSCDWRNNENTPISILLNGQTFDAPFETWVALLHVRLQDKSRFFWTDAICIDQKTDSLSQNTNHTQRDAQLSRLHDIYQGATGLIAWIGRAEDNLQLVFEHLDRCRTHNHINWCHYSGDTEDAFRKLAQRPWFYRAWSAQELALCKEATIKCGFRQCEWLELTKCSSFLAAGDYYHPLKGPDGRSHLHHLRELTSGHRVKLRDIFLWNRHCRADDPRDKVFGALLLDTGIQFDIPIDYSQHVTQLFQSFTQKVIESSRNLDFLHWIGSQKCIDGLPSWVPDYNIVNPIGALPRIFGMSASYSIHYPLELLSGFEFRPGNILAVHGHFVEKIERTADELEVEDTTIPGSKKFSSVLNGWETLASSLTNKRFPQATIDAFSDTLIGNDDVDLLIETDDPPFVRKKRPLSSASADKFNAWYKRYGTGVLGNANPTSTKEREAGKVDIENNDEDIRLKEPLDEASMWYSRRMELTCYGRHFFVTDKGSMGLARGAREGDDIVFFPGGKYPFVLRVKDDGTYELVGDCFLYDLDVFALFQDKVIKTREFLLT
ncbi:heterokaryon incompatibility protein-domain-containing protein [Jackrogersella minutella]|nr:heterokaryon incompatibility protein-domain-containing protein [Jackrogersella minutella]